MEELKGLLEKFLTGTCTDDERRLVDRSLDTKAGKKMLYELFERRERARFYRPPSPRTRLRLDARQGEVMRYAADHKTGRSRRLFGRGTLRSVAAVLVGAAVLGAAAVWQSKDGGLFSDRTTAVELAERRNPEGMPERFVLPDGSEVWLAAGSSLRYPAAFSREERAVELSGEAFFDVERDEKRPFTIRTGELQTRVLGTSFKISAFEGRTHEVSVATGRVSVGRGFPAAEIGVLTPGMALNYDARTGAVTRSAVDPAALAEWKSGILNFDKLPMSAVAEQLGRRFGIEVAIDDPSIATFRINSTFFPEESADTILNALCLIGGFQYKRMEEKCYTIFQDKTKE